MARKLLHRPVGAADLHGAVVTGGAPYTVREYTAWLAERERANYVMITKEPDMCVRPAQGALAGRAAG